MDGFPHGAESGHLTAREGRCASPADLRRLLSHAPGAFLEGALHNANLSESHVILLLRNRRAGPALLREIATNPRWRRSYEVKKGVVLHPQAPPAVSRNVVPHLYWSDLAEVSRDLRAHPLVRRQAERLLAGRLGELGVGERVALARRASRGLIPAFLGGTDTKVMQSLLGNPKLIESEAVRIASSRGAAPALLGHLAGHHRWSGRRGVRLELLRNPRTPIPAALRLVEKLERRDLQELFKDGKVPKIVRVFAERRIHRAGDRTGRARPDHG